MEHGPNGTLDELIKKKRGIPENIAKIMFAQLINFHEYMLTIGVMHRDLKPQNIMLDISFNIKMIDFGDARKVHEDSDEAEEIPMRKDTFVGTVNYQSPEVISDDVQGHPLDVWALGCILFKMLTGTVPFKGTNPIKVYADIKNRNIQWPEAEKLKRCMSP